MQLTVEIPERFAANHDAAFMSARLKLLAALALYQSGELSLGAACELAGVDRYEFLAECKNRRLPVLTVAPQELEEDLAALRGHGGACLS